MDLPADFSDFSDCSQPWNSENRQFCEQLKLLESQNLLSIENPEKRHFHHLEKAHGLFKLSEI